LYHDAVSVAVRWLADGMKEPPSPCARTVCGTRSVEVIRESRRRQMHDAVAEPAPHHVDVPEGESTEHCGLREFWLYQCILELEVALLERSDARRAASAYSSRLYGVSQVRR
jgi:hypothetical protein